MNKMNYESPFSEIRRYVDLRIEEARLKAARSISSIISQIAAVLVIAALAIITICLLAVAFMQWLNELLGQPWGTFIACGMLIVTIAVLYLLRKRLFTGTIGKDIARALGSDTRNLNEDIVKVENQRRALECGIVIASAFIKIIRSAFSNRDSAQSHDEHKQEND